MLTSGSVIDRYEVVGWLGEGGMAVVYTVRHTLLGSEHVLKVLTHSGKRVAERLMEEGRAQATLKHPNVVEVSDIIDVHGSPGLVMEWVHGPALDALLAGEPLPLPAVESLFSRILAGVSAAHGQNLVHRDLKPGNILLQPARGDVVPKVADFGLVKRLDAEEARTRTGATMGTPQYMAPEQIKNARHVDARSDLFALGAIAYELFALQPAFQGESLFDVFHNVTARNYVPLQQLRPDVPQRIVDAIDWALEERDARPESCEALWGRWSAGRSTLEEAAEARGAWTAEDVVRVEALTPGVSPAPSPADTAGTFELSPPTVPSAPPEPLPGPASPVASGPSPLRWLAPAAGLVLLGGLGAVAVAFFSGGAPPSEAPRMAPAAAVEETVGEEQAPTSKAPASPAPAPPSPVPAAPALVVVQPVPSPAAPAPASAPVRPAPTPTPTPAAAPPVVPVSRLAQVEIEEAAPFARVVLVPNGGGEALAVPGDVPPGTYTVQVTSVDGMVTDAFQVDLQAGQAATFRCGGRQCVER